MVVVRNYNPSYDLRGLLDATEIGPSGQVGEVERNSILPSEGD
jgi:hypothetical protein